MATKCITTLLYVTAPPEHRRPTCCVTRSHSLQINHDVARWLRAADEQVAIRRLVERLGSVDDRARNQAALTVMTNTGPARPANRDVACLSELQNTLVGRCLPVCGDAAARERYERTGVGLVGGKMRSPPRGAHDTGRHRFTSIE